MKAISDLSSIWDLVHLAIWSAVVWMGGYAAFRSFAGMLLRQWLMERFGTIDEAMKLRRDVRLGKKIVMKEQDGRQQPTWKELAPDELAAHQARLAAIDNWSVFLGVRPLQFLLDCVVCQHLQVAIVVAIAAVDGGLTDIVAVACVLAALATAGASKLPSLALRVEVGSPTSAGGGCASGKCGGGSPARR